MRPIGSRYYTGATATGRYRVRIACVTTLNHCTQRSSVCARTSDKKKKNARRARRIKRATGRADSRKEKERNRDAVLIPAARTSINLDLVSACETEMQPTCVCLRRSISTRFDCTHSWRFNARYIVPTCYFCHGDIRKVHSDDKYGIYVKFPVFTYAETRNKRNTRASFAKLLVLSLSLSFSREISFNIRKINSRVYKFLFK